MYLTRDEYTAIKKKIIAHSTDNYIKYYVTLSVFLFLIAVYSSRVKYIVYPPFPCFVA